MTPSFFLVLVGVLVRAWAALLAPRSGDAHGARSWASQLPLFARWGGVSIGAWLVMAGAGTWTPLWAVLILGLLAALAELLRGAGGSDRGITILRWGLEAGIAMALGLASLPRAPLLASLGIGVALATAGRIFDLLGARASSRIRWAGHLAAAAGAAFVFAYHPASPAVLGGAVDLARSVLLGPDVLRQGLTVSRVPGAEAVDLAGGLRGWIDRPPGPRPLAGALLFHGADAAGSNQPTALALRRALVSSGYVVLSLDLPGFGGSPSPPVEATLAAFDPLEPSITAYQRLRDEYSGIPIVAVGHSRGTHNVLRLLGSGVPVGAGVLLGSALPDPPERDAYWYGRFLREYGYTEERLPETRWRAIRSRYMDAGSLARALSADHPPVRFVRFRFEHENLAATRDSLFDLLPGRKGVVDISSTHYLDTSAAGGLMVGDVGVARRLVRLFRELRLDLTGVGESEASRAGEGR